MGKKVDLNQKHNNSSFNFRNRIHRPITPQNEENSQNVEDSSLQSQEDVTNPSFNNSFFGNRFNFRK